MKIKRIELCFWALFFLTAILVIPEVTPLPEIIRIGGLFEETEDQQEEFAFRYAVNNINADISILPKSSISAQVRIIAPQDSFRAFEAVCDLLESGVAAIIGSPSPPSCGIMRSTCDFFHIPVLQTHWDYRTKFSNFSMNLYPQPSILATAYADFIRQHKWKSFTIIYEDNDALIRLQELIKSPRKYQSSGKVKVTLRLTSPQQDFKKLMKDLRILRENNFIVDLPLSRVRQLFEDAKQVEMMTPYQNYLLTTLDIHTEAWTSRLDASPNITALRLIDPQNPFVSKAASDWIFSEKTYGKQVSSDQPIKTEAALLYDAVGLVAEALIDLNREQQRLQLRSLFCDATEKWNYGTALINKMKMIQTKGLSGNIRFDENGERTFFSLDVVKVKKEGLVTIGRWDPEKGMESTESSKDQVKDKTELFRNKTLRVTTLIIPPYMMYKEPIGAYTGNERFNGYCADLLEEIAKKLKFDYVIDVVEDGKHGNKLPNGEWNGLVGKLLKREADLAIGDLTHTYLREEVVDFTMPFMNLGISILFRKPQAKMPSLLAFLDPFSAEVWLYMVTAFLGVSLLMFLLARLSPYEWRKPHPPYPDSDIIENQFSLLNIFWFVTGSIMQQGSDILPRAISTRLVASSWWFFTLIMIKTYTANLAAFLTSLRMVSPITSVSDLARQTEIQYGCLQGGSTQSFFRESNYSLYKRMWAYMEAQTPSVFTKDNAEGIQRVLMGNYAFFMESTSIEYITASNCDLTKIGHQLDNKGYGIATQPGSPYRSGLSSAILHLQESGKLHMLQEKWWRADKCPYVTADATTSEMGMANVAGVFLVLWIGMSIGFIIVIIEFVWNAKKQLNREPILKMLWKEMKFILSFHGSSRPMTKDEDEPLFGKSGTLSASTDDNTG